MSVSWVFNTKSTQTIKEPIILDILIMGVRNRSFADR